MEVRENRAKSRDEFVSKEMSNDEGKEREGKFVDLEAKEGDRLNAVADYF